MEKNTKATMGVNSVQNLSKHISLDKIPLNGDMNISEVSNIQATNEWVAFAFTTFRTILKTINVSTNVVKM